MSRPEALYRAVELARTAGVCGRLVAPAAPGAVVVSGRDAARFLHAQLTNDVAGLAPGQGNVSARVKRSGHLVQMLLVVRLPRDVDGAAAFLLVTDRDGAGPLIAVLEPFVFSEEVTLSDVTANRSWVVAHGPGAAAAVAEVIAVGGGGPAAQGEVTVVELAADVASPAAVVIHVPGFADAAVLIALAGSDDGAAPLADRLEAAARAHGLAVLAPAALAEVLAVLALEAGVVRVGSDPSSRERLLPETCLDSRLVSTSKGCYLGQEVIARVRTYGSLPHELRGLVVAAAVGAAPEELERIAAELPAAGADLVLADGTVVGQVAARAVSPAVGAVVVLAFVDRAHRTPGRVLEVATAAGHRAATVVLLPLYRGGADAGRAAALYAQAITVFAAGREDEALALLERALALDPSFADGYEAVGLILGRARRFEEAIAMFKRLEERAPAIALVDTNLSLFYMKIGDKETAEAYAARALGKVAGGGAPQRERDADEAARRRAEAERKRAMFSRVLEVDAADPIALFGLGNACAALDQWREAESAFARAITAQRTNGALYLARGRALERLARGEDAVAVYRAGMEVASRRGDLAPLREMQTRALLLGDPGQ